LSNAVDPGWVPTKMGGPGAPDDLEKGHLTQTWLAVSDEAAATVSGRYSPSPTGAPRQGSVQPPLSRSAFGQARGIDGRVSLLIQTRSFSLERVDRCCGLMSTAIRLCSMPQVAGGIVSELCHIPPETPGKHLHLRRHVDAYRCWVKSLIGSALVGFGVRQHSRRESISKRAPSTTRPSLPFRINHLRS
jgi:hypothetical protein